MRWIITGPESSGKTTLCKVLSQNFNLPVVDEYARDYIDTLDRNYTENDLIHIAQQQITEWNCHRTLETFFDTDLLTTIIWYQDKFNKIPSFMMDHWLKQKNGIYLLCVPDIDWTFDPQRENPEDRDRIFRIYFHLLNAYGKPFKIIAGTGTARNDHAIQFIRRFKSY